ncbi:MAG: hypothetical protein GY710_11980 [Desulfobacteraceae bacterium]|nr:hypothetical protein [Desulfobacteraceae bacterium]
MAIDINKFKNSLSQAFIELLNSKRGVASTLAKAVGKPGSFMNEVKRGKPVNSIHLKAVGIIFGPGKLLELLSIETKLDKEDVHSVHAKPSNVTIVQHQDLVTRFKNPEKGLQNNEHLIGIEAISDNLYEKTSTYLKTTHEAAMILKEDGQKKKLRTAKDQMSQPDVSYTKRLSNGE